MNNLQKPRLAGVMGWPVDHSLSPALHGFWLKENQLSGSYVSLAVQPENLQKAILALPMLGFAGVNLTVPHKEAGIAIVSRADGVARRVGAVNTLIVLGDGTIEGRNTDGYGFIQSLAVHADLNILKNRPVAVLGAGGAARSIVVALQDFGVSQIFVINRTLERAEVLREDIGGNIIAVNWKERDDVLAEKKLLVNATTLGMIGQPALEINLGALPTTAIVTDIVYKPLMTPLLEKAFLRGNPIVDGLGMLIHQGRPGFREWFGAEPIDSNGLRAHLLAAGAR